jgi:hypothetical protein
MKQNDGEKTPFSLEATANFEEKKRREEDANRFKARAEKNKRVLADRKKKRKGDTTNKQKKRKEIAATVLAKEGDLPLEVVNQDSESEDDDEDYNQAEWKIVGHAVDKKSGKPYFKVVTGKRAEGRQKFLWGEYGNLKNDEVVGLDDYIRKNCTHTIYSDLMQPRKERKQQTLTPLKATLKAPCNHGSMLAFREETNPTYCAPSYYMNGLMCGEKCGAIFVAAKSERGPEGTTATVPTGNAPAYCCVNIRRSSVGEEGCVHVVCYGCWTKRILAQSGNNEPRAKRATRK